MRFLSVEPFPPIYVDSKTEEEVPFFIIVLYLQYFVNYQYKMNILF